MIVKTVQTLVFEYPEDYQAEVEWNKKRDGDWVHQSTDTICSVYTLTNNYLIPTKAKHSFLDNHYFEDEPQTETSTNSEKVQLTDEPQIPPAYCKTCKHDLWSTPRTCGKCTKQEDGKPSMYEPKDEQNGKEQAR